MQVLRNFTDKIHGIRPIYHCNSKSCEFAQDGRYLARTLQDLLLESEGTSSPGDAVFILGVGLSERVASLACWNAAFALACFSSFSTRARPRRT